MKLAAKSGYVYFQTDETYLTFADVANLAEAGELIGIPRTAKIVELRHDIRDIYEDSKYTRRAQVEIRWQL